MDDGDGNASKRTGGAQQEEGDSSVNKRMKSSIAEAALSCVVCARLLKPEIYQCLWGHLFCSACSNQLPDKRCKLCSVPVERSYSVEGIVGSILVDCCYAKHGCTHKDVYYCIEAHEKDCSHTPCFCPNSGCGFAGRPAELQDHLTTHHGWPSTEFDYGKPFELRVQFQPGLHLLVSKDDGQLFVANMVPAEPFGHAAVAVVCVEPYIASLSPSDWPPTNYLCVVPKLRGGRDDAGVVLSTIITYDGEGDAISRRVYKEDEEEEEEEEEDYEEEEEKEEDVEDGM
ncbi:hypothetical protein ACP70R_040085 [Stipagrostis hirtigluma subsp. patula]